MSHSPVQLLMVRGVKLRAAALIGSVTLVGVALNVALLHTPDPKPSSTPVAEAAGLTPTAPGTSPAVATTGLVDASTVPVSTAPATSAALATTVPPTEALAPSGQSGASQTPAPVPAPAQSPAPTNTNATTTAPRNTVPRTTAPRSTTTTTDDTDEAPGTTTPRSSSTSSTSTTSTTSSTTTAAPTITYATYQAAKGAGTITLKVTNGSSISLYSFAANGSWVYSAETNGPTTVKLKFYETSTGSDAEFTARISGGRISVEN